MKSIHSIFILYNPNSTGPAKQNALELKASLGKVDPQFRCTLLATKHEKHAIELAKNYAAPGVMIVSSSGDGGFHELVNGVLMSDASEHVVVGLLPSGNANDHYTTRHTGDIALRIAKSDTSAMDVLKVSWDDETVFAHSYAGLGITADIGKMLTEKRPNLFTEPWLVITGLIRRHPVRIIISGRKRRYDSVIFNLIGRMSKYLSTGEKNRPRDGTFDLVLKRHTSLTALFRHLLRHAMSDDIKDTDSLHSFTFVTTHQTSIQLDGEVYTLPPRAKITLTSIPNALHCII